MKWLNLFINWVSLFGLVLFCQSCSKECAPKCLTCPGSAEYQPIDSEEDVLKYISSLTADTIVFRFNNVPTSYLYTTAPYSYECPSDYCYGLASSGCEFPKDCDYSFRMGSQHEFDGRYYFLHYECTSYEVVSFILKGYHGFVNPYIILSVKDSVVTYNRGGSIGRDTIFPNYTINDREYQNVFKVKCISEENDTADVFYQKEYGILLLKEYSGEKEELYLVH